MGSVRRGLTQLEGARWIVLSAVLLGWAGGATAQCQSRLNTLTWGTLSNNNALRQTYHASYLVSSVYVYDLVNGGRRLIDSGGWSNIGPVTSTHVWDYWITEWGRQSTIEYQTRFADGCTAIAYYCPGGCPPTAAPTTSRAPTRTPTRSPTRTPTSAAPTRPPTRAPTRPPTRVPTRVPTRLPTRLPTRVPSPGPSVSPTRPPTAGPTDPPTANPTRPPTTPGPSVSPTANPTVAPTARPTTPPTAGPTRPPTTLAPTNPPTLVPTAQPTQVPTAAPTDSPTATAAASAGGASGGGGTLLPVLVAVVFICMIVAALVLLKRRQRAKAASEEGGGSRGKRAPAIMNDIYVKNPDLSTPPSREGSMEVKPYEDANMIGRPPAPDPTKKGGAPPTQYVAHNPATLRRDATLVPITALPAGAAATGKKEKKPTKRQQHPGASANGGGGGGGGSRQASKASAQTGSGRSKTGTLQRPTDDPAATPTPTTPSGRKAKAATLRADKAATAKAAKTLKKERKAAAGPSGKSATAPRGRGMGVMAQGSDLSGKRGGGGGRGRGNKAATITAPPSFSQHFDGLNGSSGGGDVGAAGGKRSRQPVPTPTATALDEAQYVALPSSGPGASSTDVIDHSNYADPISVTGAFAVAMWAETDAQYETPVPENPLYRSESATDDQPEYAVSDYDRPVALGESTAHGGGSSYDRPVALSRPPRQPSAASVGDDDYSGFEDQEDVDDVLVQKRKLKGGGGGLPPGQPRYAAPPQGENAYAAVATLGVTPLPDEEYAMPDPKKVTKNVSSSMSV